MKGWLAIAIIFVSILTFFFTLFAVNLVGIGASLAGVAFGTLLYNNSTWD